MSQPSSNELEGIPEPRRPGGTLMTSLERIPSESLRPPWEPAANGCCWVLRHPDGSPFTEDRDDHFACEADVLVLLTNLGDESARTHPTIWRLVQMDKPCVEFVCDACGGPKSDTDIGYAYRHFPNRAEAECWARSQGWSTDGQQWHCPGCRPLQPPVDKDPRNW